MEFQLTRRHEFNLRDHSQTVIGVVLIAWWWLLAWGQYGFLSHYYFFPLWLGYILVVDSMVHQRTGSSPIRRLRWRYSLVFIVSAPFWWIFELLNRTLSNWTYLSPWDYGFVGQAIIGSLSFSTVIPAVLTTAELVRTFLGDDSINVEGQLRPRALIAAHLLGWAMLGAMLIWPNYFFPLCWLAILFILDPVARLLGASTVSTLLERAEYRSLAALAIGGLICGWFWEMWNIRAMPKWVYSVPHVDFLMVWEMPLLGYGGYIPFALEIFAFYVIARRLIPWLRESGQTSQIDRGRKRFL